MVPILYLLGEPNEKGIHRVTIHQFPSGAWTPERRQPMASAGRGFLARLPILSSYPCLLLLDLDALILLCHQPAYAQVTTTCLTGTVTDTAAS